MYLVFVHSYESVEEKKDNIFKMAVEIFWDTGENYASE